VPLEWSLRPATGEDAGWLAELKAEAMRPDLERLGYWDEDWAKGRFLETFVPANTRVILVDGTIAGCVAVRAEPDAYWLEHFYLYAWAQGQGLGGQVLAYVLSEPTEPLPFRLAIDRGSAVQRLYERHGFRHVWDDANGVDQIFQRPAGG
jgi:GNAT superfamily N-acetyltransferase